MDLGLTDRVALVTGGSKGIGAACVRQLAAEGCDVAATARGQEGLDEIAAEVSADTGRTVLPLAGDMSVQEEVDRTVAETVDRLGEIDVLITCAGSSPAG